MTGAANLVVAGAAYCAGDKLACVRGVVGRRKLPTTDSRPLDVGSGGLPGTDGSGGRGSISVPSGTVRAALARLALVGLRSI